ADTGVALRYVDQHARNQPVRIERRRIGVQRDFVLRAVGDIAVPDYAPSSAKPWDYKTSGNQCAGAFRRLFALSVASIPARVSTGRHLPTACTTCSKRGFTGAWQGTRG